MTSTLTIYYHSQIENDKNIVVEDIENYLATLEFSIITDFQYIKHNLDINVKINAPQSQLEYIYENWSNYCAIQNDNGKIVYYFIFGKTWKSENTIELHLVMDTLNTFKYLVDYSFTEKTLIQREHKDRYIPLYGVSDTYSDYEFVVNADEWRLTIDRKLYYQVTAQLNLYTKCHFKLIDSDTLIEYEIRDLHQNYETGEVTFKVIINRSEQDNKIFTLQYYPYVIVGYRRKIDLYSEGFNPTLYKKDIGNLIDDDVNSNWYLVYKNAYDVEIENVEKIVNPVQLLLVRDTSYRIAPQTIINSSRIYATDIPKIPDTREHIIFRYKDLTAEQIAQGNTTITINDEVYTLVAPEEYDLSQNKFPLITYTRYNNSDVVGTIQCFGQNELRPYFDLVSQKTITNVAYIDVYNYLTAWVSTFTPTTGGGYIDGSHMWDNETFTTTIEINSGINSVEATSITLGDIDLTDPKIIKIIACPYAPLKELVGISTLDVIPSIFIWNTGMNALEIKNTRNFLFTYQKSFSDVSPFDELRYQPVIDTSIERIQENESKLYHSEFYYRKFVYAENSFIFALELMDIKNINLDTYMTFDFTYTTSKNVASKWMFTFEQYTCGEYDTQDYNNVLLISRNNEIALYNNSYINYLRNGYQYDNEAKNRDVAMRGLSIGLTSISSLVSFAINPALGVGIATSLVGQISNAITSNTRAENTMAQQRGNLANQGQNVTVCEDIDLLEAMCDNKAKIVEYKVSEKNRKYLFDLFHYCGYKTLEYKIPNVNTRYWFNFIQAECKYNSDSNIPEHIKDDIKSKYANGVTFLHNRNNEWDFSQQKENVELSLLGG